MLLTVDDVTRRGHYRNAFRTFARLLELGVVPIVNENDTVATTRSASATTTGWPPWSRIWCTPTRWCCSADVDGLYTAHPSQPDARRIDVVAGPDDLAGVDVARRGSAVGTGGMQTKIEAAGIATSAAIPVVLTDAAHAGPALAGEGVGTLFAPTGKRRPTRLLWLRHASDAKGTLRAGRRRRPCGGTSARPRCCPPGSPGWRASSRLASRSTWPTPTGAVVARGLVNYDSDELPPCSAAPPTTWPWNEAPEYDRTVVHRDALVVLDS